MEREDGRWRGKTGDGEGRRAMEREDGRWRGKTGGACHRPSFPLSHFPTESFIASAVRQSCSVPVSRPLRVNRVLFSSRAVPRHTVENQHRSDPVALSPEEVWTQCCPSAGFMLLPVFTSLPYRITALLPEILVGIDARPPNPTYSGERATGWQQRPFSPVKELDPQDGRGYCTFRKESGIRVGAAVPAFYRWTYRTR
jgi:hypothetical protein